MTNFIKKNWRLTKWNLFLKHNNFNNDKWYFVLNYGIGDTYLVSTLIPYIISKYKNVAFIIEKPNHRFIPRLFSDEVNILSDIDLPWELINEFGQFIPGNPIVLHPLHLLHKNLLQIIGFKQVSLLDMYKMLLGIDMYCMPITPKFQKSYTDEVSEIFLKNGLKKGNTVLLCPQANSVNHLDVLFWSRLAESIRIKGLIPVVLNLQLDEFIKIDFSLTYAIPFVEYGGYVVSLRSGFCDLISTSKAKKIIIYPNEIWFSGQLFESTSLSKLHLCNNDSLTEIVINSQDLDLSELNNKILNQLI